MRVRKNDELLLFFDEEDQIEETASISPETGDNISVYITLFVVALFGSLVLFKKK